MCHNVWHGLFIVACSGLVSKVYFWGPPSEAALAERNWWSVAGELRLTRFLSFETEIHKRVRHC